MWSQLVGPLSALVLLGGLALLVLALAVGMTSMLSARGTRRVVLAAITLAAFSLGALATIAGVAMGLKTQEIEFALDEAALVRITRKAEPLIHAIESFRARTGSAPDALDQLVPAYLNAIPRTGWRAHPNFEYECYASGTWKLFVRVTKIGAWDEFVYDPTVTQPAERGYIDRLGDWYYLHE